MNLPRPEDNLLGRVIGAPGPCTLDGDACDEAQRRPSARFRAGPLPDDYLESILRLAAQAPSGLDFEPWPFIVVRDPAARERLRCRGGGPARIDAAPVLVIAFTLRAARAPGTEAQSPPQPLRSREMGAGDQSQQTALHAFVGESPPDVAARRQIQMALTTMILVAEAYGVAAAPLQDYDPGTVKGQFGLPPEARIVALMAMGFSEQPAGEQNPSLPPLHELVHVERYGCPWVSEVA